jgi:hypothetical protein
MKHVPTLRLRTLIGLAFILVLLFIPGASSSARNNIQPQLTSNTNLFLPLINSANSQTHIFGVEMTWLDSGHGLELLRSTGTKWVRRNGLFWREVEPEKNQGYVWDSPRTKALEKEFIRASELGINIILIIHRSPLWAVNPYNSSCAPINEENIDPFARFLAAAVRRYSFPPYNIKYWEIGNEPDGMLSEEELPYGCWGDPNDPYFGGEAYGRMLMRVSEAMKRENPDIKILNGGFALGQPYEPDTPHTIEGRFFEGVLRAGAGESFDIVSFHTYYHFSPTSVKPLTHKKDWKVDYIQQALQRYKVKSKPLIRTESALLCNEGTYECRWAQADMLSRFFVRSLRDGLMANIWYLYNHDGYHNTALIDPSNIFSPRPAYFAYRHAAQTLSGSRYIGPISGVPETIEGYQLIKAQQRIIVLWNNQSQQERVKIAVGSSATVSCSYRDGPTFACPTEKGYVNLKIGTSPVYIVVEP